MPETFQTMQSIGIGGIFSLIVIDKVFGFLRKRGDNKDVICKFEVNAALKSLSRNLERQTDILDRMDANCARCREEVSRISGKLNGHIKP